MVLSIGWSDFALKYSRHLTGNSYTILEPAQLVALVQRNWRYRTPGTGEGDRLDRKVLVPIDQLTLDGKPAFFLPPRVPLKMGMPLRAEVFQRQEGEEPYIQIYVTPEDAIKFGYQPQPAQKVDVVCYHKDALLENGGIRSTDCEWEIITILCSSGEQEPMEPLTMARNFLEKPGGTKGVYTAQEFAEAIWYHSDTKRGVRVKSP
jgi:hypothetical protein